MDYLRCDACGGTLVAKAMPSKDIATVQDEASSYYGKNYWFEHQQRDLQQPTIVSRARSDLSERILYWANKLLYYKIPPSKLLELGSGHGGFVAMLRALGFDAIGSELSPSIVELARQLFDIPMRVGTVEEQGFEPATFDIIALMDVLEHLTKPSDTLATCLKLLKPDGILFVQTPRFPAHLSYDELIETQHPFLRMLIPQEHLYLFSKESVAELLKRLGVAHVTFEEPIFAHYDMFFVASTQPISKRSFSEIEQFLESSFDGRLIQAMLDLSKREKELHTLLRESEGDRAARLDLLNQAGKHLEQLQLQYVEASERARLGQLDRYFNNQLLRQLAAARVPLNTLINYVHHRLPFKNDQKETLEYLRLTQKALAGAGEINSENTRQVKHATASPFAGLQCIVVDLIPVLPGSENGGAKIFTLQLLKDLVRMLSNCKFVFLTSDVSHDELAVLDAPNSVRYCVYHRTKPLGENITDQLIGLLTRWFKVDLLFCPFTLPIFPLASVPVISVIYDLQYHYYPEFFSSREIHERDFNFRNAARLATYITCISDYVRQSVLDNSELPPERVRTIYLNASQFVDNENDNEEILSTLGLVHNEFWLYPANFWQHKNHKILLTAFSIYRSRHPDSQLKLVCTGTPNEHMRELQHYCDIMRIKDWVVFPGFLSNDQFNTLLKNAYALVYPSLYEGFGMPILEAMAAKTPVICSNVTSLPEIAGDAALLFDPRKPEEIALAMEKLEQQPELAATLVKRGADRVAAFGNAERTAQQYINLFHEAASTTNHSTYTAQGIFSDGWIGQALMLTYESSEVEHTFRAEFYLPEQVSHLQTKIVVSGSGLLETHTLQSGTSLLIEQRLHPYSGAIEILFYPPLSLPSSADKRTLTCRCRLLEIMLPDQMLELFNEGT
jgi:glycosyltransferase involved in cell wall biosynthesis/2-polyprenyl-3-methyl-5-hydroxy-6-metoxy-1,4-benzoquinol methylase